MKFLLALAFLSCATQDAVALIKANALDYQDIADQIGKKSAAEEEIKNQNIALRKANGDEALELEIRAEITRLRKVQKSAADQAIWLTMRAYDIIPFADNEPILDEGTSVLRSQEVGKSITWLPIFADTIELPLYNEEGTFIKMREANPDVVGNTASDGMSRILPEAFSSPEMLASIIIHEQRHFIQNTTAGKGDKKTTAELEVEAYEYEWRLMKVLGFSGKRRRDQEDRLNEILNGKKGEKGQPDIKGKRKQAEEERAVADRDWSGWPFPELSIKSHSYVEIDDLIRQAKGQIVIAQRDHDLRLRNTIADMAMRSCATPGRVTQAELDGLPRAHVFDHKEKAPTPPKLDNCALWLYMDIRKGSNAEDIRLRAISLNRMSVPAQPAPPPPAAATPLPMLAGIYPEIKEFAIAACRDPQQIPQIRRLFGDYSPTVLQDDAALLGNFTARMNNCEKALFMAIIQKTRANGGYFVLNDHWVRRVVVDNPPEAETPPGDTAPPDALPPGGRRPPDQTHPIIPIPGDPWKPRSLKHASANK